MKQLFYYIIIRLTTRHAATAVKIYESLYHTSPFPKDPPQKKLIPKVMADVVSHQPKNNLHKKQEIKDSLNYLRSKQIKTKQDKSSISMLEGVLSSL